MSHEFRTPLHGIMSYARLGETRTESLPLEAAVTALAEEATPPDLR